MNRKTIRRREFLSLAGGVAGSLISPFGLHAQTSLPVIGFLRVTSSADSAHLVEAFRDGRLRLGQAGPAVGRGSSRSRALGATGRQTHHVIGRGRRAGGFRRLAPCERIERRLLAPGLLTEHGAQPPDHENREREKDDRIDVKHGCVGPQRLMTATRANGRRDRIRGFVASSAILCKHRTELIQRPRRPASWSFDQP